MNMTDGSSDFFNQKDREQTEFSKIMAKLAGAGLHLGKVTFLAYSGFHGISAVAQYSSAGTAGHAMQIVGILTLELTLLSLYVGWHTQMITGSYQSLAAGITYAVGFILACFGIVVDSQLNAGLTLSPILSSYMLWGLPLSPAIMALGGLATHELNPQQLRDRREKAENLRYEEEVFEAHMKKQRAKMDIQKGITNMQLNAQITAANQIATWYSGEEAQLAITAHAMTNAPALLKQIGIDVAGTPFDKSKANNKTRVFDIDEQTISQRPTNGRQHHQDMRERASLPNRSTPTTAAPPLDATQPITPIVEDAPSLPLARHANHTNNPNGIEARTSQNRVTYKDEGQDNGPFAQTPASTD